MVTNRAPIIVRGTRTQLIGRKKWGIGYLDQGRTGPLLRLETFTTAIIVRTNIRAIKISKEADEEVRIVITLDDVNEGENKWVWEELGQARARMNSVIDNEMVIVGREGVFKVWFGDKATK